MKNLLNKLLFLFFAVSPIAVSQEIPSVDWIKNFDGIPIQSGIWWGWTNHQGVLDSMKEAGINVLMMNPTTTEQLQVLENYDFKVIPVSTKYGSDTLNWIQYYTDAKYSVWEAEGIDSELGDAELYYDSAVTDVINSGDTLKYLKLKSSKAGNIDTLIWGPYYTQDVTYLAMQDITASWENVEYTADFLLMLQDNPNDPDTIEVDSEPICIIQVTQSKLYDDNNPAWIFECTHVIDERTLTRGDFNQLNEFKNFIIQNYTLENDDCQVGVTELSSRYSFPSYLTEDDFQSREARSYIEFKVIWLAKQQYLLSIDKVTVSDDRGRELINPLSPAEQRIITQATSLQSFSGWDTLVVGWFGIDEPESIDIFEPIRFVTEILDINSSRKRQLWIAFMGHWDGAWESRQNEFGAQGLSPWEEFYKRVRRGNIIQNAYLFDNTCPPNSPYDACQGEDYRNINIWRTGELMYKQAYELDTYFGASIQCEVSLALIL